MSRLTPFMLYPRYNIPSRIKFEFAVMPGLANRSQCLKFATSDCQFLLGKGMSLSRAVSQCMLLGSKLAHIGIFAPFATLTCTILDDVDL